MHRPRVRLLPRAPLRRRKGIAPAEVIPVIDVKSEGDDAMIAGELSDQLIGRRTARSALGSEELDHDGKSGNQNQGTQHDDLMPDPFRGYERIVVVEPAVADRRNVSTTVPILISSPSSRSTAESMRRSFTHVPFLLPRSSRTARPLATKTRA